MFTIVDYPGFDEYGSERVTQSTNESRVLSSVYIFITAFDDYTKDSSTSKLMSLLDHDSGIKNNLS